MISGVVKKSSMGNCSKVYELHASTKDLDHILTEMWCMAREFYFDLVLVWVLPFSHEKSAREVI